MATTFSRQEGFNIVHSPPSPPMYAHQQGMDFSEELQAIIDSNPQQQPRPHNIFDMSTTHPYIQRPPTTTTYHHPPNPFDTRPGAQRGDFPAFGLSMPLTEYGAIPQTRQRNTPSPPVGSLPSAHGGVSRSRSRVKKRGNSFSSSSSPPPLTPTSATRPHPAAILIPGRTPSANAPSPLNWFLPPEIQTPGSASAASFSLPTPDSLQTHPFGPASPPDSTIAPADPASKQALLAHEKRRRRRESHNAVERRRRDNINEKISELATLIPECMLVDPITGAPTMDELMSPAVANVVVEEEGKEGATVKANKGMILRKSVDYIRYLQQLVRAQASRNQDLEARLSLHPSDPSMPHDTTPNGLPAFDPNGLVLLGSSGGSSFPSFDDVEEEGMDVEGDGEGTSPSNQSIEEEQEGEKEAQVERGRSTVVKSEQ